MTGRFVLVTGGRLRRQAVAAGGGQPRPGGRGVRLGAVVREAAPIIGGGGGGRPDLAQAGGKDASRLDEALREAGRLALEALKRIETA